MKFWTSAALLLPAVLAGPAAVHQLGRRSHPNIDQATFNPTEIRQLNDGFADVVSLAEAGIKHASDNDPIFKKYWNANSGGQNQHDDVRLVKEVLTNIKDELGKAAGSGVLPDATIRKDDGSLERRDPTAWGLTDDSNVDNPVIILTNKAFQHGGIKKGYTELNPRGPPAVTTESIKTAEGTYRLNWRMDTLAHTLLHEFTHWDYIVSPPLGQGTVDRDQFGYVYGPFGVQQANVKSRGPVQFADVFAWYCTESLWADELHRPELDKPTQEDEEQINPGSPGDEDEECEDDDESQHGEGGNGGHHHKRAHPQKAVPQKATPQKGTPQKGTPQKGTPQKGNPQKGSPPKNKKCKPKPKATTTGKPKATTTGKAKSTSTKKPATTKKGMTTKPAMTTKHATSKRPTATAKPTKAMTTKRPMTTKAATTRKPATTHKSATTRRARPTTRRH